MFSCSVSLRFFPLLFKLVVIFYLPTSALFLTIHSVSACGQTTLPLAAVTFPLAEVTYPLADTLACIIPYVCARGKDIVRLFVVRTTMARSGDMSTWMSCNGD